MRWSMSSISSSTSPLAIASCARTIAGPTYLSNVKSPSRQSSEISLTRVDLGLR